MVTLKSGREIDANRGLIGIDEDGEVASGYDERLSEFDQVMSDNLKSLIEDDPQFYKRATPAERIELADIMIERWIKYKQVALVELADNAMDTRNLGLLGSSALGVPGED